MVPNHRIHQEHEATPSPLFPDNRCKPYVGHFPFLTPNPSTPWTTRPSKEHPHEFHCWVAVSERGELIFLVICKATFQDLPFLRLMLTRASCEIVCNDLISRGRDCLATILTLTEIVWRWLIPQIWLLCKYCCVNVLHMQYAMLSNETNKRKGWVNVLCVIQKQHFKSYQWCGTWILLFFWGIAYATE